MRLAWAVWWVGAFPVILAALLRLQLLPAAHWCEAGVPLYEPKSGKYLSSGIYLTTVPGRGHPPPIAFMEVGVVKDASSCTIARLHYRFIPERAQSYREIRTGANVRFEAHGLPARADLPLIYSDIGVDCADPQVKREIDELWAVMCSVLTLHERHDADNVPLKSLLTDVKVEQFVPWSQSFYYHRCYPIWSAPIALLFWSMVWLVGHWRIGRRRPSIVVTMNPERVAGAGCGRAG